LPEYDLKKQTQFGKGQYDVSVFLERTYGDDAVGGSKRTKPIKPDFRILPKAGWSATLDQSWNQLKTAGWFSSLMRTEAQDNTARN
jgi:hypothetical protein